MSKQKRNEKRASGSLAAPPTAVAWYTREEWNAVRRDASDPEVFDASYDEWHANATRVLEQLRDQGIPVQRIFVRAAELRTWCAQRGIARNSKARSNYAAQKLQSLHAYDPQGSA